MAQVWKVRVSPLEAGLAGLGIASASSDWRAGMPPLDVPRSRSAPFGLAPRIQKVNGTKCVPYAEFYDVECSQENLLKYVLHVGLYEQARTRLRWLVSAPQTTWPKETWGSWFYDVFNTVGAALNATNIPMDIIGPGNPATAGKVFGGSSTDTSKGRTWIEAGAVLGFSPAQIDLYPRVTQLFSTLPKNSCKVSGSKYSCSGTYAFLYDVAINPEARSSSGTLKLDGALLSDMWWIGKSWFDNDVSLTTTWLDKVFSQPQVLVKHDSKNWYFYTMQQNIDYALALARDIADLSFNDMLDKTFVRWTTYMSEKFPDVLAGASLKSMVASTQASSRALVNKATAAVGTAAGVLAVTPLGPILGAVGGILALLARFDVFAAGWDCPIPYLIRNISSCDVTKLFSGEAAKVSQEKLPAIVTKAGLVRQDTTSVNPYEAGMGTWGPLATGAPEGMSMTAKVALIGGAATLGGILLWRYLK